MALAVKTLPANAGDVRDPPEKAVATHSSILAGKSHGQRSLEGYGP